MNDLEKLKAKGYKLQTDWQNLKNNSIFILGTKNNKNFIFYQNNAFEKGCRFIICNHKFKNKFLKKEIKYFYYKKKEDLYVISKIFIDPIKSKIIFITGTNGKTSLAFGVHQLMRLNKIKSSYIGTLGFYVNSKKIKSLKNTTPEYIEILNLISFSQKNKCKYVFIEASSIGYCEGRLGNIKYDFCLLTNLKSDHLDYHKNIKDYHQSKIDIINNLSKKNSKLLIQDNISLEKFKINKKLISIQEKFISQKGITISYSTNGSHLIATNTNKYKINTINNFVINNTISILHLYYNLTKKLPKIFNKSILPVGRSEIIYKNDNIMIMIDYAHSEDAFKNLLNSINIPFDFKAVLYGCGGDRDKSKRKKIAKVVSKYSDFQIITDDNPRNENPKLIRDTLVRNSRKSISIANREKAIKYAINFIKRKGGLLIIAGKGHENTQIQKNKIIEFSDHQIVKKYV